MNTRRKLGLPQKLLGVGSLDCLLNSAATAQESGATALGTWGTLNYRPHPDWEKEIHRLTAQRGAGSPGSSFSSSRFSRRSRGSFARFAARTAASGKK